MSKICLGCGKEYDNIVEYCPDCFAKNKDINKTGNVVFIIGLAFFVCIFFLDFLKDYSTKDSILLMGEKVFFFLSIILIMVGGTLRIETRFNYTLVDKNKYKTKDSLKYVLFRLLRYLLLVIIMGLMVFFILKTFK